MNNESQEELRCIAQVDDAAALAQAQQALHVGAVLSTASRRSHRRARGFLAPVPALLSVVPPAVSRDRPLIIRHRSKASHVRDHVECAAATANPTMTLRKRQTKSRWLRDFVLCFLKSGPVAGPTSAVVLKLGVQGKYTAGLTIVVGGAIAEAVRERERKCVL